MKGAKQWDADQKAPILRYWSFVSDLRAQVCKILWMKIDNPIDCPLEKYTTYFDFRKYLLTDVDYPTKGHLAIYALLCDSFLSSENDRLMKKVVST